MFSYVALALLTIYIVIVLKNRNKLPPGPWSLPIVGYLPWLDPKVPYKSLHDLAKKYGPVYGLHFGNIFTVVISDAKIIRKVFSKDETTGRAPLYLTHGLMKGYGIICSEGKLWKNQRKFVYGCLRQLGGTKVGGTHIKMENLIKKHSLEFTDYISSFHNPATLIPSEYLRHCIGSVMTTIVFGECWTKDDETWKYLQHLQEEGIKHIGIAGPLNFIPILRFLPRFKQTVKFLTQGLTKTHKIYDRIIEKHQESIRENLASNSEYAPRNFLDAFLMERQKRHNSTEAKFYSDLQMKYLLADMFGAGLDTTLTTLNWYILYISIHTDIQKKVREELVSVLQGNLPTMKDFQFLPLFEASVAEVQRIRSTVPIGIPHGTLCDLQVNGFNVPKNSMIVPLLWAVHMDEKYWKDPENFDPYRFLDENGRFFKPDEFIPFQIGKRMCVGDELAKMLLYFFCSIILQKYELNVNNIEDVDLRGNCGITLTPNDYEIIFKKYSV